MNYYCRILGNNIRHAIINMCYFKVLRINFEHSRITHNMKGVYNKRLLIDNLIASIVAIIIVLL